MKTLAHAALGKGRASLSHFRTSLKQVRQFRLTKRRALLGASLVVGALLIASAVQVITWQSPTTTYYNRGLAEYHDAMQNGDSQELDQAQAYFELSEQSYEAESHGGLLHRVFLGTPSTEVAAMAYFQEGMVLLAKAQATQQSSYVGDAVTAFEHSLTLNPGGPYQGVSTATADRMNSEAMVVKYDLELLFKKNPQQQQQKGQGQGKPGQPAQHAPNQDPGNMPGHGDNNQI